MKNPNKNSLKKIQIIQKKIINKCVFDMKKTSFLYLILPLLALILEILPFGAVLNFANVADDGTIGYVRETYSYFSLMPVGYANIFPFCTAILTCVAFALIVAYCITEKHCFAVAVKILLCVCVIFSIGPVIFGIKYLSVTGVVITLLLIAELIVMQFIVKKNTQQNN